MSKLEFDRLRAMRAFVAVARTLSFTKAADVLSVESSTLSRRVATLEGELGVQLLTRTTRTVTLTEPGKLFFQRAARILEDLDETDRATKDFASGVVGTMRICASALFARAYITPYLAPFLKRFPEVQIDLVLSDYPADVVIERADIAIHIGKPTKQNYIVRHLVNNERIVVASPALLERIGAPESPWALPSLPCIALTDYFSYDSWQFLRGREEHPIRISGPLRATNAETLIQAAVAGIGFAWVSRLYVRDQLERGELVRVLDQWKSPDADIFAVMPPQRFLPRRVRAYVDYLKQEFKGMDTFSRGASR